MIRAASRVLSVVASAAVGAGVVIQALAAGAAATAPAAGSPAPPVASPSCGGTRAPACGPGSGGGANGDRIWAEQITVTVTSGTGRTGGGGTTRTSTVAAAPCGYVQYQSGKEMATYLKQLENDGFPIYQNEVPDPTLIEKSKKDDTGHWFMAACAPASGSTPSYQQQTKAEQKYIDAKWYSYPSQWWVFAQPGNEPRPPVPPLLLATMAYDAAVKAIPQPTAHAAPVGQTLTQLPTWTWLDAGDTAPVTAVADGDVQPPVTVRAEATHVGFGTVPAGATVRDGCAGGGQPYTAGGRPACAITFGLVGTASFTMTTDWHITVTGGILTGLPDLARESAPVTLQVAESESIGTN